MDKTFTKDHEEILECIDLFKCEGFLTKIYIKCIFEEVLTKKENTYIYIYIYMCE